MKKHTYIEIYIHYSENIPDKGENVRGKNK